MGRAEEREGWGGRGRGEVKAGEKEQIFGRNGTELQAMLKVFLV